MNFINFSKSKYSLCKFRIIQIGKTLLFSHYFFSIDLYFILFAFFPQEKKSLVEICFFRILYCLGGEHSSFKQTLVSRQYRKGVRNTRFTIFISLSHSSSLSLSLFRERETRRKPGLEQQSEEVRPPVKIRLRRLPDSRDNVTLGFKVRTKEKITRK